MADRMDIVDSPNSSTSRDPRLASRQNRPTTVKPASLDTQNQPYSPLSGSPSASRPRSQLPTNPPLVNRQHEASCDQFIRGVSDLVKAAVEASSWKSEKERLQKRKETSESLLKKAKSHANFPSTAAFFHQTTNEEDEGLKKMDETMRHHLANYQQLENALKTKWSSSLLPDSSKSEEKISQLQYDIQSLKTDMENSKSELSAHGKGSQALESQVKLVQDMQAILEKVQTNSTNSLIKQGKENAERIEKLSSELANVSVQSPSQETIPSQPTLQMEGLKEKVAAMAITIDLIQKSQQDYSSSLDGIIKQMEEQRKELVDSKTAQNLEQKIQDLERLSSIQAAKVEPSNASEPVMLKNLELRLKDLENNTSKLHKPDSNLVPKIQDLTQQLDQLQQLQGMKDDLQFAEMEGLKAETEGLKTAFGEKAEELRVMKDDYSHIKEEITKLGQTNPALALQQQLDSVATSLRNTQRMLESVRVGLHSLETRYNNLSTEPIVRNMVAAMQEMYPSAAQITEQLAQLRGQAEREFPHLRIMVDQLVQARNNQTNLINQLQRDATSLLEEHKHVKTDHLALSGEFKALLERFDNSQSQWADRNDFQQLQANFDSLTERLREHTSNVEEQLQLKDTAHKQLVENLEQECDSLKKEVRHLASDLKNLLEDVNEVKTVNTSNSDTIESQGDELRCLFGDIHRLKESTSSSHRGVLEQIESINEAMKSKESFIPKGRALEDRIQTPNREQSITCSDTASALNFDDMAETNPALALRERTKKKRLRPSGQSEDEKPSRPRLFSSPAQSFRNEDGVSPTESAKKKKKKRKLEEAIMIDD